MVEPVEPVHDKTADTPNSTHGERTKLGSSFFFLVSGSIILLDHVTWSTHRKVIHFRHEMSGQSKQGAAHLISSH